jgi:glutathione S-transferase
MPTLYDFHDSGNGYKVRLVLALTGQTCAIVEKDIDKGETRTPDFLALNPNGRVPALVLDDGSVLAESNAILVYLAEGTSFWPDDRLARARVLQWMFFEQYSHEPYVATPRYILRHLPEDHPRRAELPGRQAQGYAAFGVMETQLAQTAFLTGSSATTADIALFAYTHRADESGMSLDSYPAIRAWIGHMRALPGFIEML